MQTHRRMLSLGIVNACQSEWMGESDLFSNIRST